MPAPRLNILDLHLDVNLMNRQALAQLCSVFSVFEYAHSGHLK